MCPEATHTAVPTLGLFLWVQGDCGLLETAHRCTCHDLMVASQRAQGIWQAWDGQTWTAFSLQVTGTDSPDAGEDSIHSLDFAIPARLTCLTTRPSARLTPSQAPCAP